MQETIIKIGPAPDYVMTQGRVELFHKIEVVETRRDSKHTASRPVTHRSLYVAIKQVQEILLPQLLTAKIEKVEYFNAGFEIVTVGSSISVIICLPAGLGSALEFFLVDKFTRFFDDFLEKVKRVKS